MLTGGEKNFTGRCELNDSEFSTYSAEAVNDGESTTFEGPLFQKPPTPNGTYVDGRPPANHLGCSVHWFQEHRTFKNGGLVALSEYENGVRFLQIHKDGSIEEQGFFAALGSSSSSPKWAPSGDVLYSIDYDRGIDIMRWNGQHYVPKSKGKGVKKERGRVRGTNGTTIVPRAHAPAGGEPRPARRAAARTGLVARPVPARRAALVWPGYRRVTVSQPTTRSAAIDGRRVCCPGRSSHGRACRSPR